MSNNEAEDPSSREFIFKQRTFDVYWVDKYALMYKEGFIKVSLVVVVLWGVVLWSVASLGWIIVDCCAAIFHSLEESHNHRRYLHFDFTFTHLIPTHRPSTKKPERPSA